ncbi:MAG TPA: CDP-glycerol glycerophosphotransferase family protein [Candidatus Aquicultor sp.]|jgi:hypothetical protein
MSKKILLFSRDPGGANTIIPLVKPLEDSGYKARVFGKDSALEKYLKAGIAGVDIMSAIKEVNPESIKGLLKTEEPDVIVTGTSTEDTEKYLWEVGEQLGIPSFAIIDQWINYASRFLKGNHFEASVQHINRADFCFPSKILVMDEYAKQEAIQEGLEDSRILVTGHPYFEALVRARDTLSAEGITVLREKLGIGASDFVVTFASEPVSKDYDVSDSGSFWGYTERSVFKELIDSLNTVSSESERPLFMVIKLHPRDDTDTYEGILPSLRKKELRFIVDRELSSSDLILMSDLVVGMSSMFLIEAVVLSKPVLSVLIGLNRVSPFVLDRREILKSIVDKETLLEELRSIIIAGKLPEKSFSVIENPVSNVIQQMEKYLCQS